MSSNNAVILLKGQTYGAIKKGETLDFVKQPYNFDILEDGDIVIQTLYLSIDPYLVHLRKNVFDLKRGKIRDESIKSYSPVYRTCNATDRSHSRLENRYSHSGLEEYISQRTPNSKKAKLSMEHWIGQSIPC
jgi:NADPH-dependent curcumin reductase CurA